MRNATMTDFEQIQRLLELSFPVDERRSAQAQRLVFEDPRFRCLVLEDGDRILGFMTVWQFDGWAFAEHLTTDPSVRNQGFGSQILQAVITSVEGPLCLEVELPETDMAKRRIGFYQRNGFTLNEYPYIQPAYAPDQNPVPLLLMTTDGPIDPTQYEMIRDTLYREVYKVQP